MFATVSRSRRNKLTNVIVRQSMRVWSGNCSAVSVQVFDILNVIQLSGGKTSPEPFCRLSGGTAHMTSQNVCTYYDVRLVARYAL